MSAFKVGQRVRIVHSFTPEIAGRAAIVLSRLGPAICDVTGTRYLGHDLDVDGIGPVLRGHPISCEPSQLAPLTDPKADEFIAAIKKLKPYSEPLVKRIGEKA